MSGIKIWWGIVFAFIFGLGVFGYYFYTSGGAGLSRVVFNYLMPDVPDKKYGWNDFRYRGEGEKISGFYAYGDSESFSIWTLSGLKKYYHMPGTSVYMHRDTCEVVRQLTAQKTDRLANPEQIYFNLADWEQVIKSEYLVTVLPLVGEGGYKMVDKVWSVSGRYKVLGRIEEGVCD